MQDTFYQGALTTSPGNSSIETFRGATGPLAAGPTSLAPTPPPGPDLDLILTRFRPDFDLKLPFQVRIRSKSGPNQVRAEGSVPEG